MMSEHLVPRTILYVCMHVHCALCICCVYVVCACVRVCVHACVCACVCMFGCIVYVCI